MDIRPEHLHMVKDILKQFAPGYEVLAFGSRVAGTAKRHSDLDLAVVGKKRIATKTLYRLEEAFAESDLPFRVDVLDWDAISSEFRKIIENKYEIIQEGENESVS
jgi:predicted nucleotidyltransferase